MTIRLCIVVLRVRVVFLCAYDVLKLLYQVLMLLNVLCVGRAFAFCVLCWLRECIVFVFVLFLMCLYVVCKPING